MDVAQSITSAVMPGAAVLPASSDSSAGALTPSPLFREMFVKAALTAELPTKPSGGIFVQQQPVNGQIPSPDRLLMNGKGVALSAPMFAMSDGEAVPEPGGPDMTGLPDGQRGTLLARAMANRQTAGESAQNQEHRGLSLQYGRDNKGVAKADLSEGQLETELLSGPENLLSTEISSQEKPVVGSETAVSDQRIPRQNVADDAELPALISLPAGFVSVMVPAPVVQSSAHEFKTGMPQVSTPTVLSDAVSSAAKTGNESVRETLPVMQNGGTARMEPRPVVAEGRAELLSKNDGVVFDAKEERVASLVQTEAAGLKAVPGKPEHMSSEGSVTTPVKPEAGGENKSVVSPVVGGESKVVVSPAAAASPDVKETVGVALSGEKMTGKDHSAVARHENVSAMKQARQDVQVEGKGETVLRELPSGVTVLNPAQTVTMGRPVITADAPALAEQASGRGRVSEPDGKVRGEKGGEISVADASEKIALKKEASSENNSNLGHDSETAGGNNGLSHATVSSGSFDTVIKGHMEPVSEVSHEHEVSALHENILSQVRDKLVIQDPSANVSKVTLKLNPHELGELQINVRLENQKMTVDITAQNPVVKEALLQNIDQLKDSLMRQNISMERFNVSTGEGQGQAFNQSFREGRQAAYQTPDTFSYPLSGYYQEDTQVSQAAFADSRENSLVDMRF